MAGQQTTAVPRHDPKVVTALRRFAISITVFNILGYTVLGFEQPWLWPLIALATAYATEIGLELIGARAEHRAPRFTGNGPRGLMEFLLPAHITGLALNMLIYVNDRVLVMMFGVVVAVSAKWILRAPVRGKLRHYMNPSNLGITVILLLFPWASIAPPYHFTEKVDTWVGWLIVAVILISGTVLNAKLTGRMWLIGAWLITFALQAIVRGLLFDTAIPGALGMMTGVAFVLFTNYMVTDPGTTPSKPFPQVAFGAGIALLYGFFMVAHIAYGLFLATATACLIRGLFLWSLHFVDKARKQHEARQRELDEAAAVAASANGSSAAEVPAPGTGSTPTPVGSLPNGAGGRT
ncbi:enediyne biosynthesis protein [Amycolatopsis saalfeldensis]|uniref:NQR2, RnfD, RnfE family n=1 Tax=Amycolatopsis saalfeldensis TaxID=394193 RepID=A0A1H8YK00_9PSEU|nr:enediyne biosynthesis protein [Amycolatopsis saalfeldensis]SEP52413.1 NQR2, RnfD, RnfE family [Amycolatopsis saalfeldensis]